MKEKSNERNWKNRGQYPKLYSEAEVNTIEAHIAEHFGNIEYVFHEIVSPDIHVDIVVISPTPERDYNVLVTMGMGAHRMNIPKDLVKHEMDRAEMMICLPKDWKLSDESEEWYWPLRWLKIMARLPIEQNTWLGFGHTASNGEPFADNTRLSGMIVSWPKQFSEESHICKMPNRSRVLFYQLIPLYDKEMDFKLQNDADALFKKMTDEMMAVVDISRPNVIK